MNIFHFNVSLLVKGDNRERAEHEVIRRLNEWFCEHKEQAPYPPGALLLWTLKNRQPRENDSRLADLLAQLATNPTADELEEWLSAYTLSRRDLVDIILFLAR